MLSPVGSRFVPSGTPIVFVAGGGYETIDESSWLPAWVCRAGSCTDEAIADSDLSFDHIATAIQDCAESLDVPIEGSCITIVSGAPELLNKLFASG